LVASVVVLPAGELVVFGAGDGLVFGGTEATGLGAGEGAFLVAAETAIGEQQARAARHAAMVCNLFFMWGLGWIAIVTV
jgi:hypothetical protein